MKKEFFNQFSTHLLANEQLKSISGGNNGGGFYCVDCTGEAVLCPAGTTKCKRNDCQKGGNVIVPGLTC
jgi:hypothetical protein